MQSARIRNELLATRRHVERGEMLLMRQREIVFHLELAEADNRGLAHEFLATLMASQRLHTEHLDTLLAETKRAKP